MTVNHATAASAANLAAGQAADQRSQDLSQRFLTLLVAQMKNQDPLNPADNSEVTSQIAQINTVTGINNLNHRLAQITGQIDTTQQLQASALIGKKVLVPGDTIKVGDEGAATPFGINLGGDAAKVSITITDNSGEVVYQSNYQDQPAGAQSFQWDGKDASGAQVDPGGYQIHVSAEDEQGDPVASKPLATGYVDGVVSGESGPELDLGPNGLVGLDSVYQIL